MAVSTILGLIVKSRPNKYYYQLNSHLTPSAMVLCFGLADITAIFSTGPGLTPYENKP